MRRRQQILGLVVFLLAIGVAKAGHEVYRWYRFADERVEIIRLQEELERSAVGIVHTRVGGDSLRARIEEVDAELATARNGLDRAEAQIVRGQLMASLEARYRRDLDAYNERVAFRNEIFREWRRTLEENHRHVERYNIIVDSIRSLAAHMGEPHYPIGSPAEIAERSEMRDRLR